MHKVAFFLPALMVCALGYASAPLVACSSQTPAPVADDDIDGGASTKVPPSFERDGSVYDSTASPTSGLGELLFRPSQLFTGRDGIRTFKVPVAVYDADADLSVTLNDPEAGTIAKATLETEGRPDGITDNGSYFLITALKAGTHTLTATSRGRSTTATLTVTSYLASSHGRGEARYANGIVTRTADRACTTCHVKGAGIDHSPATLASADDQDVGIIVTTGVRPTPGAPQVIRLDGEPGVPHGWTVTDAEKDGLVTYLRSLPPRGFK